MAMEILVNGAALLLTGTGALASLEALGYGVDGVTADFRGHTEDVNSDNAGTRLPADVQEFGEEAFVRVRLVSYDEAVLAKVRTRRGAAAEGLLAPMGTLIFGNGNAFRVLIASPVQGLPWNFPTCYLHDAYPVKLGTKRSEWDLTFRAIAYIGTGSATGRTLYNRAAS